MRILSAGAATMRHSAIAVAEAVLVAAIVAALLLALAPVYQPADFLAGTESAQAAKGGNGGGKGGGGNGGKNTGTGTISLVLLDGADSVANYMERAAFDVSTTATDRPFVGLRCWQGGNFVLDGYTGYFDSYMFDPWIYLGSPYWAPDLSANCTARLFWYDSRGNQNVVATLDFDVAP